MAGAKNQLVRRGNPNRSMVLAPLTVAAVRLLVNTRGLDYVVSQASNGLLQLSKSAMQWLTSASTPVGNELVRMPAPTSIGTGMAGSAKFQGDIRIKHRELISSVINSDGSLRTYRVNPVDSETFPYLSGIANQYDEYKIHSLRFGIISSAGTTEGGRWYIAWDPDSTELPLNSGQYLMNMRNSLSATAWQSGELAIPPMDGFRLCQHFPDDLKDYGQLLMKTNGTTAASDVYVEYDITLRNPEVGAVSTVLTTTVSPTYATTGFVVPAGPEVARPTSPLAPRTFELASGRFLITTYTIGTGLTLTASTVTNANAAKERRSNFSTTESWSIILVDCTGVTERPPATVALGGTWSTITQCTTTITPIDVYQYNAIFNGMP